MTDRLSVPVWSAKDKYRRITELLIESDVSAATMESCTSGSIVSALTDTEGASAVIRGGFVTYCNEAKIRAGVPEETIDTYGVYSEETALAMARACRENLSAEIGIGITGTFGNVDPANADSTPGKVCFAVVFTGIEKVWTCTVPEQPSRAAYKQYMCELVADRLLEVVDGYFSKAEARM